MGKIYEIVQLSIGCCEICFIISTKIALVLSVNVNILNELNISSFLSAS